MTASETEATILFVPLSEGPALAQTAEIELFMGSAIEALRGVTPSRRTSHRSSAANKPLAQPLRLPKRVVRGRCTCGVCKVCEENARWEAVFNAKFADPTYYANRGVRVASPLSDFSR